MKQKKSFKFKDIKGILSRDEMKQIKGGSGGGDCSIDGGNNCCGVTCTTSSLCFGVCYLCDGGTCIQP